MKTTRNTPSALRKTSDTFNSARERVCAKLFIGGIAAMVVAIHVLAIVCAVG